MCDESEIPCLKCDKGFCHKIRPEFLTDVYTLRTAVNLDHVQPEHFTGEAAEWRRPPFPCNIPPRSTEEIVFEHATMIRVLQNQNKQLLDSLNLFAARNTLLEFQMAELYQRIYYLEQLAQNYDDDDYESTATTRESNSIFDLETIATEILEVENSTTSRYAEIQPPPGIPTLPTSNIVEATPTCTAPLVQSKPETVPQNLPTLPESIQKFHPAAPHEPILEIRPRATAIPISPPRCERENVETETQHNRFKDTQNTSDSSTLENTSVNKKDIDTCVSYASQRNPSEQKSTITASSLTDSKFSFASKPPPLSTGAKPVKNSTFAFGMPKESSTANPKAGAFKFTFGSTTTSTISSTTSSATFSFGNSSAPSVFSFGTDPTATSAQSEDSKSTFSPVVSQSNAGVETSSTFTLIASQSGATKSVFAFGNSTPNAPLFTPNESASDVKSESKDAQNTSALSRFSFSWNKPLENATVFGSGKSLFGSANRTANTLIFSTPNSSKSENSSEVEFISETKTSKEERELAEKLQLPSNYFTYKYVNDCSGCVGCDQDDIKQRKEKENDQSAGVFQSNVCSGTSSNSSIFSDFNNPAGDSDDDSVVKNDQDPYFEPVVPLPDIVEVKTGEENEEIKFCERGKLFRYSEDSKEWKERGVGDLKILFHPMDKTYRLLLRREQVHKVVLNQRISTSFNVQPLSTNKNSWCWFGMNLPEEQSEPVVEKLAIKFKTESISNKFSEMIQEYLFELDSSQRDQSQSQDADKQNDPSESEDKKTTSDGDDERKLNIFG